MNSRIHEMASSGFDARYDLKVPTARITAWRLSGRVRARSARAGPFQPRILGADPM